MRRGRGCRGLLGPRLRSGTGDGRDPRSRLGVPVRRGRTGAAVDRPGDSLGGPLPGRRMVLEREGLGRQRVRLGGRPALRDRRLSGLGSGAGGADDLPGVPLPGGASPASGRALGRQRGRRPRTDRAPGRAPLHGARRDGRCRRPPRGPRAGVLRPSGRRGRGRRSGAAASAEALLRLRPDRCRRRAGPGRGPRRRGHPVDSGRQRGLLLPGTGTGSGTPVAGTLGAGRQRPGRRLGSRRRGAADRFRYPGVRTACAPALGGCCRSGGVVVRRRTVRGRSAGAANAAGGGRSGGIRWRGSGRRTAQSLADRGRARLATAGSGCRGAVLRWTGRLGAVFAGRRAAGIDPAMDRRHPPRRPPRLPWPRPAGVAELRRSGGTFDGV